MFDTSASSVALNELESTLCRAIALSMFAAFMYESVRF